MPQDSPFETYTQAGVLNERVVPDMISLIDPVETPFVNMLGLNGARDKFQVNLNGRQVEWLMDAYRGTTAELAATAATGATQLTVTDATPLKIGDVLLAPDSTEYINVTGISYSGNTIDVAKNFGTSGDNTQATGTLTIITRARLEGADADQGPIETITSGYNATMILEDSRKVTGTSRAIDMYGISDPLEYQRQKSIPELMRDLEKAALQVPWRAGGSATAARLMGGLNYFVTTNTMTTARTALAIADFRTVTLSTYTAGGNPDLMVVHPQTLNTLTAIYDSTGYLRVERTENSLGMSVNRVVTPFATFNLLSSRNCGTNDIHILDSRYVGFYTLRPMTEKVLSNTGDHDSVEFVGEYTLCVAQDTAHGRIVLT